MWENPSHLVCKKVVNGLWCEREGEMQGERLGFHNSGNMPGKRDF